MPSVRSLLQLVPYAASTGIGSLPHAEVAAALALSFKHEIPFLPQLPALSRSEGMIAAGLAGLPGLRGDGTIDVEVWRQGRDAFAAAVEVGLSSGDFSKLEPTVHACFEPFLGGVKAGKFAFAKVQIVGPGTARWFAKTSADLPKSERLELDQQIFRLLWARSLAMVGAVGRTNATPILFLDEPGLVLRNLADPTHRQAIEDLKLLIRAVQQAGALVGIHCCANTDWATLLRSGLDILSFDARLSLDAVLKERAAYLEFIASGASLALGIIPTEASASYAVSERVDSVEGSLGATSSRRAPGLIVTAACGLALHSVPDAERILDEVVEAQQRLRAWA